MNNYGHSIIKLTNIIIEYLNDRSETFMKSCHAKFVQKNVHELRTNVVCCNVWNDVLSFERQSFI